jgi:O-antigen ligase
VHAPAFGFAPRLYTKVELSLAQEKLSLEMRRASQMTTAMRWMDEAPGWLFLAALIYVPWNYGCTTERGIIGLNWILGAALILWIIDLLVAKRRPRVPFAVVILSVLLLAIGWWMALNARWIYDSEYYIFVPIKAPLPRAPGSVDQAISVAWMLRATLLLGAASFVADLSQRPVWLLRLWWTVGIAGGSIALLGLLQKATGAPMIFWQQALEDGITQFFATYYYHANAGAFLNLVFAPTCGLAFRSLMKPKTPIVRGLWLSVVVILLVAIFANTSRMAQLIAVLLMIALAIGSRKAIWRQALKTERKIALIGLVVVAVTFLAIAQASHLDQPFSRWQNLPQHLQMHLRWLASQAALGAVHDAGWFGFGPGTFRVIFPYYTGYLGNRIQGVWRFLHEDYLQTLLEWGWIGSALWAAFALGGIAVGIRNLRSLGAEWRPRYRSVLSLAVLALAGVALHGLVDFPLQIASLQLYVATYLGLCWGSSLWKVKGEK